MVLPPAETAYLAQLVSRLRSLLRQELVGVYLFGSAAYGDYRPGRSDLDVQAVVTTPLGERQCRELAGTLKHASLPCPTRRLEFVCYAQPSIQPASRHPQFELNLNTGAHERDRLTLDHTEEASHWFLLDIAIGRELGHALFGPESSSVFAPIPRLWQLEAIADSLAWHSAHEPASANSILNACRGWRYANTHIWGSKVAGAAWARQQRGCPPVVEQALRDRGGGARLPAAEASTLVQIVTAAVQAAMLREYNER